MSHNELTLDAKAAEIINKKPFLWELKLYSIFLEKHFLKSQLDLSNEKSLRGIVQSKFSDLLLIDMNEFKKELTSFLEERYDSCQNAMINFDDNYFPQNNEIAFGPPGRPGSPDRINTISIKFAAEYRNIGRQWIESKAIFDSIERHFLRIDDGDPNFNLLNFYRHIILKGIATQRCAMMRFENFTPHVSRAANLTPGKVRYDLPFSSPLPSSVNLEDLAMELRREIEELQLADDSSPSGINFQSPAVESYDEILKWIGLFDRISKNDLKKKLLPLGCLVGSFVDEINEKSLDMYDDYALTELGDGFAVNKDAVYAILNAAKD